MKKSLSTLCILAALSITTFSTMALATPVADDCRADIEARLKDDFHNSFFQKVTVNKKKVILPLREISNISCEMFRGSGPVGGPKLFDCEVKTTAALDADGEEIGAGDMSFSVRVQARTCAVLTAEISGEE